MCILVTQYIGYVELRKALWSERIQWEPLSLQPSWSCTRLPQVLSWSYRPHHLLPSVTDQWFQGQKGRNLLQAEQHISISEKGFLLCSADLVQSQATSQTTFEKPSGGVSSALYQDGFFLGVQCLRIGTAPSGKKKKRNWAPWTVL